MSRPSTPSPLARYTPNSCRWRRVAAGLSVITASVAVWALYAIASGVKGGPMLWLAMALFGTLAMALPAVGAAALLAPDAAPSETTRDADAVETLKQRYAAGDIDEETFDRTLDDLLAVDEWQVETDSGRRERETVLE